MYCIKKSSPIKKSFPDQCEFLAHVEIGCIPHSDVALPSLEFSTYIWHISEEFFDIVNEILTFNDEATAMLLLVMLSHLGVDISEFVVVEFVLDD